MLNNKSINRVIALMLALILCISCSLSAAGASDASDASDVISHELLEKITADPNGTVQVFVERKAVQITVKDMPSYDRADRNSLYTARKELAAINKELNQKFIEELVQYADFTVDSNTNTTIVVLTMKGEDVLSLAECGDIFCIESMPDGQWINMSADTADIRIVYNCAMTAVQQKRYNDADWQEKVSILTECYKESKDDLLGYIGMTCEYEVLRDTSINQIYLRVPASAVDEIKQADIVRSLSYYTLPESKLNDKAQKLIAETDPRQVVKVTVSTDRGDVAAMRAYFNVTKQEMNAYFEIEDENGVNEWMRASKAYYADFHRQLLDEIAEKTDAVYTSYSSLERGGEIWTDLDTSCWTAFYVPVSQLETLGRIEGISYVTYEEPKEPDPYQNWFVLGGDLDLAHKICGEPNEYGMFYVPPGKSFSMDEEEYARFKEIEYVKGVIYCRPAPDDGWWKLEGDEELLKAAYGEPNEDGRYYVPKKDAVKGDVDYDYTLTVLDATHIQRKLAELGVEHFNANVADYDDDGDISIMDATRIQRTLAEIDD